MFQINLSEDAYTVISKYWRWTPEEMCAFHAYVAERGGAIQLTLPDVLDRMYKIVDPNGEINDDWSIKILWQFIRERCEWYIVPDGLSERTATAS